MGGPLTGIYGSAGIPGSGSINNGKTGQTPYASLNGGSDSLSLSGQGKQKKGLMGAITDVGKGIFIGAFNSIKNIFTIPGIAMLAGTAGLIAAFGAPVVMPFLIGAGLLTGGVQMFNGFMKGDWKKVGEGIFTLGATGFGAKYAPKEFNTGSGKFSVTKIVNQDGNVQAMKPTGILDSTIAYLKAPFRGFGKVENGNIALTTEGKLANPKGFFSAAGENVKAGYASMMGRFKGNAPAPEAASNVLPQPRDPRPPAPQADVTNNVLPLPRDPKPPAPVQRTVSESGSKAQSTIKPVEEKLVTTDLQVTSDPNRPVRLNIKPVEEKLVKTDLQVTGDPNRPVKLNIKPVEEKLVTTDLKVTNDPNRPVQLNIRPTDAGKSGKMDARNLSQASQAPTPPDGGTDKSNKFKKD